ncbi:hypothetical protein [Helicobacter mesocricetorum]|uniref:hypothetical protein n=1 Tax=Helicobacter mesocricetorum TaxID=87012 RepID=UPI000CF06C77|nr:hypothetical protein [Helicobacter mesocricetorum]
MESLSNHQQFQRSFIASHFTKGNLVIYFFVILSLFSILMVGAFSINKNNKSLFSQESITRFEIFNFNYYKISPLGVEIFAYGKIGKENKEQENELENFNINHYLFDTHTQEALYSYLAIYDNKTINFPKGVYYVRNDIQFWSERAAYTPSSKELLGNGDFIISSNAYHIKGKDIIYKDNQTSANAIKGILKMDEQ